MELFGDMQVLQLLFVVQIMITELKKNKKKKNNCKLSLQPVYYLK